MGGGGMMPELRRAATKQQQAQGCNDAIQTVRTLQEAMTRLGMTADDKVGFIVDDSSVMFGTKITAARRSRSTRKGEVEHTVEQRWFQAHDTYAAALAAAGPGASVYLALLDSGTFRPFDKVEEVVDRRSKGRNKAAKLKCGSYTAEVVAMKVQRLKQHFEDHPGDASTHQLFGVEAGDEADRELLYIESQLLKAGDVVMADPAGAGPLRASSIDVTSTDEIPDSDPDLEPAIDALSDCTFLVTVSTDGDWIVLDKCAKRHYVISPVQSANDPSYTWNPPPQPPPAAGPVAPAAAQPAAPQGARAPGLSRKAKAKPGATRGFLVIKHEGIQTLLPRSYGGDDPLRGHKVAILVGGDYPGSVGAKLAHIEAGCFDESLELDWFADAQMLQETLSRELARLRSRKKPDVEWRQALTVRHGRKVPRINRAVEVDSAFVETLQSSLRTSSGELAIHRFKLSDLGLASPLPLTFLPGVPPPALPARTSETPSKPQFYRRPALHSTPSSSLQTVSTNPRTRGAGALLLPLPKESPSSRGRRHFQPPSPSPRHDAPSPSPGHDDAPPPSPGHGDAPPPSPGHDEPPRHVPHTITVRPLDPGGPSLVSAAFHAPLAPPIQPRKAKGKGKGKEKATEAAVDDADEAEEDGAQSDSGEDTDVKQDSEDESEEEFEEEEATGQGGQNTATASRLPKLTKVYSRVSSPPIPLRAVERTLVQDHITVTPVAPKGRKTRRRKMPTRRCARRDAPPRLATSPSASSPFNISIARPFANLCNIISLVTHLAIPYVSHVVGKYFVEECRRKRLPGLGALLRERQGVARLCARVAHADPAGEYYGGALDPAVQAHRNNQHDPVPFPVPASLGIESYTNIFLPLDTALGKDLRDSLPMALGDVARRLGAEFSQGLATLLQSTGFNVEVPAANILTQLQGCSVEERERLAGEVAVVLHRLLLEVTCENSLADSRDEAAVEPYRANPHAQRPRKTKEQAGDKERERQLADLRARKEQSRRQRCTTAIQPYRAQLHAVVSGIPNLAGSPVVEGVVDLAIEALYLRDIVVQRLGGVGQASATPETLGGGVREGLSLYCRCLCGTRLLPDFAPDYLGMNIHHMFQSADLIVQDDRHFLAALQRNFDEIRQNLHVEATSGPQRIEHLAAFGHLCAVQVNDQVMSITEAVHSQPVDTQLRLVWRGSLITELADWQNALRTAFGISRGASISYFVKHSHAFLDVMRLVVREDQLPAHLLPSGFVQFSPSQVRLLCYKLTAPLEGTITATDRDAGTFFHNHVLEKRGFTDFKPEEYESQLPPDGSRHFVVDAAGQTHSHPITLLATYPHGLHTLVVPPPPAHATPAIRTPYSPGDRAHSHNLPRLTLPLRPSPKQRTTTKDGIPQREPFFRVVGQPGQEEKDSKTHAAVSKRHGSATHDQTAYTAIDPGLINPNTIFNSVPAPTLQDPTGRNEAVAYVKGGTFRQRKRQANQAASRWTNRASWFLQPDLGQASSAFFAAAHAALLSNPARTALRDRADRLNRAMIQRVAKQVVQLACGGDPATAGTVKHIVWFVGDQLQQRGGGRGGGPRNAAVLVRQYQIECRSVGVQATFVIVPEWWTSQLCPDPGCEDPQTRQHTKTSMPKRGRKKVDRLVQCEVTRIVYHRDGAATPNIMMQGVAFLGYKKVQYRLETYA
ncbi:hypothetical protein JCM10213_007514 [Rhodosporidiobolus nylandii]